MHAPPLKFRADVQGLRAVAVLSVAIDHAGFEALSGGFVGVDVFFVISGFLITGLLLREGSQGSISLREFYSRRARRILPAATLVIAATTVATLFLLGFVRARTVLPDALWSGLFAANIKFGRDGTDYFAAGLPPSPLQHYWSLAVEEQFYLAWPLLMILLMGLLGSGRRVGVAHRRLLGGLALAGAASLAYSVVLTADNPTAAYFSTPARAWELAAGAAVAVASPRLGRLPEGPKAAMSWLGLAAILLACVIYSPATSFPGYAVVLPVVGSALVLAGGIGGARYGAGLVLDRSPMQHLGNWSYSFYLWHWPVLVIGAGYLGRSLSAAEATAALGLSVAAAAATYHLVENPFRKARLVSRNVHVGLLLYPASVAAIAVTVVLSQAGIQHQAEAMDRSPALDIERIAEQAEHPLSKDPSVRVVEASVLAARDGARVPGGLTPSLIELGDSHADTGGCHATGSKTSHPLCEGGQPGSERTLALLGDSHARAWIPAIGAAAERAGWSVHYFIKLGCTPASITSAGLTGGTRDSCDVYRSWALTEIERLAPDVAVVASDVPPGVVDPRTGEVVLGDEQVAELWAGAYADTMRTLAQSAGDVVALGDAPGLGGDPGECLAGSDTLLVDCTYPTPERAALMNQAARGAARAADARFVDAVRWFCADGECPTVIGEYIAYRDEEHISSPYARSLADALGRALRL